MLLLDIFIALLKCILIPLDLPFIKIDYYFFPFGLVCLFWLKCIIPIFFIIFFKLKNNCKQRKVKYVVDLNVEEIYVKNPIQAREIELEYIITQIPLMKGTLKCFIFWMIYDALVIIPYLITLVAMKWLFYTTFGVSILLLASVEIAVYLKFVMKTWELKSRKIRLEEYLASEL